jgi:hypothetical protein
MRRTVTAAVLGAVFLLVGQSALAGWIDWSSATTGTMNIGSSTVGVTLSGNPQGFVDGDYYYNNASTGGTSATGTYAGMAPSDFIQVAAAGSYTLTFDQVVDDLYMSLISVGQPSYGVTYDFNNAFSVHSFGSNYWGYGGYSVSGDNFTGNEFNGILHFAGSFTSLTFTVNPYEYWHGFNFASYETRSVPEPMGILLLGLGLVGLFARRNQQG